MKIIILIALRGVKFPEGGAAAPVAPPPPPPPGYALAYMSPICALYKPYIGPI